MIYVTSDLHGYSLDGFKALLDKAGFTGKDELYVLGDVIDRGRDGIKILKWLMCRPDAQLILGNHVIFSSFFIVHTVSTISLF